MEKKPQFSSDGVQHATINNHRFHLRMKDPAKDNFLWIDGKSPSIVLDETAADFVSHLIDAMWKFQCGEGDETQAVTDYVVEKMYEKYGKLIALPGRRVTRQRIKADLDRIFGILMAIAEGACPAEMTMGPKEIKYGEWIAPARMDLALTYRCNLKCNKCYIDEGQKRVSKELTKEEWFKVYEILWGLGIPQVVFTGGEPTLRDDLVELISEAEEFVTGLVTNGLNLFELADDLKKASLDYVQVTIESFNPTTHDKMTGAPGSYLKTTEGIKKALEVGLQVVTNTTLTKENAFEFSETIKWLSGLGIKNIACNTLICSGRGIQCKRENGLNDFALKGVLIAAQHAASKQKINLQWYSPTCYTLGVNPLELGFGVKTCSAAAHNMIIEPDGSVLPCQSWMQRVGNILVFPWSAIWGHPLCIELRAQTLKVSECNGCVYEQSCAGGCPLDTTPRKKSAEKGEL